MTSYEPAWWVELSVEAIAQGHDRHSAGWWAAMRDLYLERFPDADQRSKDNMCQLAAYAERHETEQGAA